LPSLQEDTFEAAGRIRLDHPPLARTQGKCQRRWRRTRTRRFNHEEVAFDASGITSRDWSTYPILTMAEIPELRVIVAGDADAGIYGQGSESANALAAPNCRCLL
jgi:hypothetical protein